MSVESEEHEVFVKRYPASQSARAWHEARMLRLAAHPGVVGLLGATDPEGDGVELRLVRLPGPDLDHPPAELAGDVGGVCAIGAALATTVGDLHHVGVVHGALRPGHVILDGDQQPILCGFGDAGLLPDGPRPSADVSALVDLVIGLLPERPDGAAVRRLRRKLRRCRSADAMARQLAPLARAPGSLRPAAEPGSVPPATAPGFETDPDPTAEPESAARSDLGGSRGQKWQAHRAGSRAGRREERTLRRRRRAITGYAAGFVFVLLAAFVIHRQIEPPPVSAGCPAVDLGCGAVAAPGGVITLASGRYQVGAAGDVVVLGRWACTVSLPAVLRPSTGQVWVFDRWPTGATDVAARQVATVAQARSLRVVPGRCDRLKVIRRGGPPPVTIEPDGATP